MEKERKHHLVVAISRQMASGGSYIGQQLASRLGCAYLDRDILLEAAERLHEDPEALEKQDGKKLNFWERIRREFEEGIPSHAYVPPSLHLRDSPLFKTEKDIMREAARRGPVVVVGRAGFYVLRDEPGLLSVFLHAPFEFRVEKTREFYFTERNNLKSIEDAKKALHDSSRQRADFIKSICGREWRDARNFHICLDSCKVGWGQSLEIIYNTAMKVEERLRKYEVVHV